MTERYYPSQEHIGQNCMYWQLGGLSTGCCYPKAEVEGRRSCEGVVDDVCLYVLHGVDAPSLTDAQKIAINTRPPSHEAIEQLPPGDASPLR